MLMGATLMHDPSFRLEVDIAQNQVIMLQPSGRSLSTTNSTCLCYHKQHALGNMLHNVLLMIGLMRPSSVQTDCSWQHINNHIGTELGLACIYSTFDTIATKAVTEAA